MQDEQQSTGPGPVIIYNSPAARPSSPATLPGGPTPSGPGPIVGPRTNIGGLLSLDPNRSVGDLAISGGRGGWPVHGRLPMLGRPAPRENVFGRIQSGQLYLASTLSRGEFDRFIKTLKGKASNERTWFELNPATWPVIKINGARKLEAARSLNAIVGEVAATRGPQRKFSQEHLEFLRGLEAQLRSDQQWQVQVGGAQNVLASTVNAFASAAIGVLDALGPKKGLLFAALYNSVDEVFSKGAAFDPAAWRDASR